MWSVLGIAQAGDRARVHCGERVRVHALASGRRGFFSVLRSALRSHTVQGTSQGLSEKRARTVRPCGMIA